MSGWTVLARWEGPYPDPSLCDDGWEPEPGVVARGDGGPCGCGAWTPWRERSSGCPACSHDHRDEGDRVASLPAWAFPEIDQSPFPWE